MKQPIHVALTGAAGQIGYALVFRIASGQMFGPDQPVSLHLIEIESALPSLTGLMMELDDCALPLLHSMSATANLSRGFDGANWALLVGSVPRREGMERQDLLGINGRIFTGQGRAIQENAASDVRVLVIGNPCNTNCLIAQRNAPDVPAERWYAMTRLDENRAKTQLAQKAAVPLSAVERVTIWGNHSATQFPDFANARINGAPATDVITDREWLEDTVIPTVQQRGASSAASAANGIVDSVISLCSPTRESDWHSVALISDGSYGVPEGLVCSFPTRCDGAKVEIVRDIPLDEFGQAKLALSVAELQSELEMTRDLLPS